MTERGVEKRGLNCSETMENLTKLPVLDEKKERKWHNADFIKQVCLIQKEKKIFEVFRNVQFEFNLPVIDKRLNVY